MATDHRALLIHRPRIPDHTQRRTAIPAVFRRDRGNQIPAGLTTRTTSRLIYRSPPRIARQTSWDNQSDTAVQRKILLPRSCSKNSQTHQPMQEMHANKADGQPSPHPTND